MKGVYPFIVGLVVTLLIACQSPPAVPPTKIISDYCDSAFPILLLKSELPNLSQESKRQILVHNETWEKKCSTKLTRQK